MKKIFIIVGALVVVAGAVITVMNIPKGKKEVAVINQDPAALLEAEQAMAQHDIAQAKQLYQQAMLEAQDPAQLKKIQERIGQLNMVSLFSPIPDECSIIYVVKPNDALYKIAKQHNTTVGLIKRSNGLTSDIIMPGQKLKVTTCTFSIVVDKSQNTLALVRNGESLKSYIVSTGKDSSTPAGTFRIINKLENPTWHRAGAVIPPDSPDNILGSRWMGFDLAGYGIHGTTEPQNLGMQVTLGCVRMNNEEVEELYDIVPVGTEVTIVE